MLEHVGAFANQARLIAECTRVARKAVFLTTPNRWFPVEFHTVLPLVHWLPKPTFRALMRKSGRDFFAEESNLNLMTASELTLAAERSGAGARFDLRVANEKLGLWPANLLLIAKRKG